MIKESIESLIEGKNLTAKNMSAVMNRIMEGDIHPAAAGAFLALLRCKGETVDEITAAARIMREKAATIEIEGDLLDTCSTGGTGINHFNISTAAAFVVAGSGVKVAKHGNRAVSGRCGSADVLEKLGVNLEVSPQEVKRIIEEAGIGFLFAPVFHKAMKNVAVPRKGLGIRTVFNILGPLTNPAGASCQLLGVFSEDLTRPLAKVLANLGVKRAMVVHGHGGLDEVSLAGATRVSEVKDGKVKCYKITPDEFGLPCQKIEGIIGSDASCNASALKRLLEGEKGPLRDFVLANSATALRVAGSAEDLKEGVKIASHSIDSGRALDKLKRLQDFSAVK